MRSIPIRRRRVARLFALSAVLAAAFAVAASPAAAATIPAAGVAIDGASLEWSGDQLIQTRSPGPPPHFFSAGISDGTQITEATYKGTDGNAEVLLEKDGGAVATWADHLNYGAGAGEHQVVRLKDGTGRIDPDGSAEISWDATFSVNFYGGTVPFSIEDPTLTVAADGTGALTGTLIGCGASQADPGAGCVPFPPIAGAQVATFSGVEIDPLGKLTIDPDYEGVEVDTTGGPAQDRTVPGWGAWPQSFVSFQVKTGLSAHFYSSSTSTAAQPEKVPYPIAVDFGVDSVPVAGASLDWTGNELMQSSLHGFKNYFSAGISNGKEVTYRGAEGNAEIYLEGSRSIATWSTREGYGPEGGQRQVAHLTNGTGVINADGSAEVEWDASFSVNFYGGLVPFTVEDPMLVVGDDGTGELVATLVGCEASREDVSQCVPFASATEVQLATFAGVAIAGDELTIAPEYAEVVVTTATGASPQLRTGSDWGAWPQSLVDFQDETGLSSYWYSSGDGDAAKPPLPLLVDFAGRELEIPHEEEEGTQPGNDETQPGDTTAPTAAPAPPAAGEPAGRKVHRPAKLRFTKKAVKFTRGGVVKLATVTCPRGGEVCRTVVPARVAGKIGGRRYGVTVLAPKRIATGKTAAIKVRLSKGARKALHGKRKLVVRVRVGLFANGVTSKQVVRVKIARRH